MVELLEPSIWEAVASLALLLTDTGKWWGLECVPAVPQVDFLTTSTQKTGPALAPILDSSEAAAGAAG